MPHIHEAIDFTVAILVVYTNKILLVHHKKLNKWLPPGGHIELNQNPEEALFAELQEETGLTKDQVIVYSEKPAISSPGTTFLYTPAFLDIHDISQTHKHIGMTYIVETQTDQISLSEQEHHAIRWFTIEEMDMPAYDILPSVKFYAREALKKVKEKSI